MAFVESVLSSERFTEVQSPFTACNKKRPANSPVEVEDSNGKKPGQTAKRSLYNNPPTPAPCRSDSRVETTRADVAMNSDATVEQLIRKMSGDMHMLLHL